MSDIIHFRYGAGGALVCDVPIEGVTYDLAELENNDESGLYKDTVEFYSGRYFIAESMSKSAAREIAGLLGGVLDE